MQHWTRPGPAYDQATRDYWCAEGLDLWIHADDRKPIQSTYFGVAHDLGAAYPPELDDLVRIHRLIRSRRCMTVLELGVGYSTLVIADALSKNRSEFEALTVPPDIRNSHKWLVHSVDTSAEWIAATLRRLPPHLAPHVRASQTEVNAGTFAGQICHFYDELPDVTPDFIYLDGPSGADVKGAVRGVGFQSLERTVMSGDLLAMEPLLLPGCMILVDGRTNNARFLRNNLRRTWAYLHDPEGDVTTFELREPPLGRWNRNQLEYCLGAEWIAAADQASQPLR